MLYLILFGIFVALAAALSVWCRIRWGRAVGFVAGVALTVLTAVLFFLNKSDSVADTFLEKLADMSPPLITAALVIGWWVGYAAARLFARARF